MSILELINRFNTTIDTWLTSLDRYTPDQLLLIPEKNSWSIGQLYVHLCRESEYFLSQAENCMQSSQNTAERASSEATLMFGNNEFPNARIEGPPSNKETPQPESTEALKARLLRLKKKANSLITLVGNSLPGGKSRHPGLGYFSAKEWLQFAEMHLRHHFRQKARIDSFLQNKER